MLQSVGIVATKTHLVRSVNGDPVGTFYCEFSDEDTAKRAVSLNGTTVPGGSGIPIKVELLDRVILKSVLLTMGPTTPQRPEQSPGNSVAPRTLLPSPGAPFDGPAGNEGGGRRPLLQQPIGMNDGPGSGWGNNDSL
jgi:hypothetical protein